MLELTIIILQLGILIILCIDGYQVYRKNMLQLVINQKILDNIYLLNKRLKIVEKDLFKKNTKKLKRKKK